ncbi:MAG TPA: hypothetical protein VMB48_01010 [Steroidobacteraceae bacterium]|nr:hypothetical protein [Steroidobacteraceae bacterium]
MGDGSGGTEGLLAWDARGATARDRYARLRARARYPDAARAFARAMLTQAETDRALDAILKDAGRNVAAKCLAYLHVTGGLTLPRLKALCASTGLVSPGRARLLLIYLRHLGYATPSPRGDPKAPTRYDPTAQFLETWRRQMRATLESVAVLESEVSGVITRLDQPAVFDSYVRCISEAYLEGLKDIDTGDPFFQTFMHRYAGTQIVHSLVIAASDAFPPQDPIAFNSTETAKRFSVSRLHVRRMMDAAQRTGLLRLTEGALVWTPEGRAAVDHIYATQLIVFLVSAARTVRTCLQPAESTGAA